MLPDGRVLLGSDSSASTALYNPGTNTWTTAATKYHNASSDEESWTLLPDGTVLTVEVVSGINEAQKYIPAENRWVSAGAPPQSLFGGAEIGPGVLLPDGRAFFLGASGHTAFYTPPANVDDPGTWQSGPDLPNGLKGFDTPAALLPNGKVLLVAATGYSPPGSFFEYDPVANTFNAIGAPTPLFTHTALPASGSGNTPNALVPGPAGGHALDACRAQWGQYPYGIDIVRRQGRGV
jgi:hypothetical protein